MHSGKYLIITLLSFTLPCVSNSFLLHPGLISASSFPQAEWLQTLSKSQPIAAEMMARSPEEQHRLGYFHTLREICQATLDVDTYWRVNLAIGACLVPVNRRDFQPHLLWLGKL